METPNYKITRFDGITYHDPYIAQPNHLTQETHSYTYALEVITNWSLRLRGTLWLGLARTI